MTTFRPMLSATCEDITKVRLPAMASPKLDGFRCVIKDGKPLTRNLKPIPNRYVRERLTGLPAFDGELIVGSPVALDVWNTTSSGIASEDGGAGLRLLRVRPGVGGPESALYSSLQARLRPR